MKFIALLFEYSLTSGIIILILYVAQSVILNRCTYYRFHRGVILSVISISLILPFLLPIIGQSSPDNVIDIGKPVATGIIDQNYPRATGNLFYLNIKEIIVEIYGIGLCISLIITIISYLRLYSILRRAIPYSEDYPEVRISTEIAGPFSWSGKIFLRPEDIDNDLEMVISHERYHIYNNHYYDLMFMQFILIIEWYNPLVWIAFRQIKLLHEYEADDKNLRDYSFDYQTMLIRKSAGDRYHLLTDRLNSNLKNRFIMMKRRKSSPFRRVAALLLLPIAATTVSALSASTSLEFLSSFYPALETSVGNSAESEHQGLVTNPGMNNGSSEATFSEENKERVYDSTEEMPEFKGGIGALMSWLGSNIKYPDTKAQGRVIVQFVVGSDGKISDAKMIRSVDPLLDEEALRVVMAMPEWEPGKIGGKPVATKFTLPVTFKSKTEK